MHRYLSRLAGEGSAFDRLDNLFVALNKLIVALLLAVMVVLVFGNVVLRYGFSASIGWVEELSRYMMVWLAWLAIGLAYRSGAHIALDFLENALPEAAARALRAFTLVTMIGFFGALIYLGGQYAIFSWGDETPMLRLPFGLIRLAIPVGSAVMLLHLLLVARSKVTRRATAEDQAHAAEMGML